MDSEREEGGRNLAGVNDESVPSDSEHLCTQCDSVYSEETLPYGSVCDKEFPRQLLIKMPEVPARSELCFLCRKIVEFFNEWSVLKFGNQGPDLLNATAGLHIGLLDRNDDEDNPKAVLVRIKVVLIVPNPSDENRPYEHVLQFQKCSQPPMKVEDFCNGLSLFNWESGEEEAYNSGRNRPLVADTRLFLKWKESCCDIYGNHCNSIFQV